MAAIGKTGPLAGLTVIEMAGLGPAPFAALMLAEMGARVVRIERTGKAPLLAMPPQFDLDRHGREVLELDVKMPEGVALMLRLLERADVLIEGYRPGHGAAGARADARSPLIRDWSTRA